MSETREMEAKHAIITDVCRANHGEAGAMDEAVRRIREEYEDLCSRWPIGKDVKFHLVLSLERKVGV